MTQTTRIPAGAVPTPTPQELPLEPVALAGGAPPVMDRDFIARNQIVERYLAGKLPVKGATDFERFCREEPELLDEIGLAERVNAGLRLLEASGKPEPWQESPRRLWENPPVLVGLCAAVIVLALCFAVVGSSSAGKSREIVKLKALLVEQPLEPASTTQTLRIMPARAGASTSPVTTIGGGRTAQLADFRIDMTRSPYRAFRVTIDRVGEGRLAVLHNVLKDSNGNLHLAFNTSALGPGTYQFTIDGLSWRGDPDPDSTFAIAVQH